MRNVAFGLRAGGNAFSGQVGVAGDDGAEAAGCTVADGEAFVHKEALGDEFVEIWRVAGVCAHRTDIMPAEAFEDNKNHVIIMAGKPVSVIRRRGLADDSQKVSPGRDIRATVFFEACSGGSRV